MAQYVAIIEDNGPDDVPGQSSGPLGAAGSGCSTLYTAQTWQKGVNGYSSLGEPAFDGEIDISLTPKHRSTSGPGRPEPHPAHGSGR